MTTYQVFFIDNEGTPHNMQLGEMATKALKHSHELGEVIVISCEEAGVIR